MPAPAPRPCGAPPPSRASRRPPPVRPGPLGLGLFLAGLLVLGGGAPPLAAPLAGGPGGGGNPDPTEGPVPVLLVPGWGDQAPDMAPLRDRLTERGWPESRVAALTFRDAFGSNQDHAEEVDLAIRTLRALTGSERVDVVAHSMGGLAVRYLLRTGESADTVRRVVFLGTPHRGTAAAVLAWGDGGREMVPGSDFLMDLNQGPPVPEWVEALSIRTPVDLRVIPASSARLVGEGVENVEICCPTHNGLVDHEDTFLEILRFLQDGPEEGDAAHVRRGRRASGGRP